MWLKLVEPIFSLNFQNTHFFRNICCAIKFILIIAVGTATFCHADTRAILVQLKRMFAEAIVLL